MYCNILFQYSVSIFCFVPVNQCWFWIENSWFIVMSENLKRPDLSVPVNWCTQSLVKCDLSCLILTHCLIRRKVQCQLNIVVIYLVVIILYNCCTLIDLVQMLAFVWAISWLVELTLPHYTDITISYTLFHILATQLFKHPCRESGFDLICVRCYRLSWICRCTYCCSCFTFDLMSLKFNFIRRSHF